MGKTGFDSLARHILDNVKKTIIVNKESTGFSKVALAAYHEDCDTVIDEVLELLS